MNEFGSDALKLLTISNTTASVIARRRISASLKEEVYNNISDLPFSLSFDESADLYGPAYLSTHVKFVKEGQVYNKLLSLNEIGEPATGEELHNIVQNFVFKGRNEVLTRNIIGVCIDKGPNMILTLTKELTNRLKKDVPKIIVVHDFSNALNTLCAALT